ncbi:SGNH/GDSL hydrolase family protein [Thermodesulfobacteriota bacterium]
MTFIGALFFTALVAEIFLRVLNPPMSFPALKNLTEYSPVLGYKLSPLLRDRYISTNSHGLRDQEFSLSRPEGIKRILGIGDSFTFGYKVDLDECYLKQLQSRLNKNRYRWEVINAGVTGYNMWQYLAYFKHYGYKFEPDIVSIGVYFDDFYGDPPTIKQPSVHQRYHSLSSVRLNNFIRNTVDLMKIRYRYLFEAKWLRSIEDRRLYIERTQYNLLLNGSSKEELYDNFEQRLQEFAEIAKERNIYVIVIFIPDIIQVHNPKFQAVNKALESMCRKLEVEFLDITPFFEAIPDIKSLYLLPHDAHTSPKGHRIIAREVEKRVRKMNIESQLSRNKIGNSQRKPVNT